MADLKETVKELFEKIQEYAREAEGISAEDAAMAVGKELDEREIDAFVEGAYWAFNQVEDTFRNFGIDELIEKENEHEPEEEKGKKE